MRTRPLIAGVVVVGLVGAWYLFRPERAFLDRRVDEPAPAGATTVLRSGEFAPRAHGGRGRVEVLELAGGERVLRLSDLDTSDGPDLEIYLLGSAEAASGEDLERSGFLSLGPLKGNIGSQNYPIPAGVDLARFPAVSVWCRRFGVNFTTAALGAPGADSGAIIDRARRLDLDGEHEAAVALYRQALERAPDSFDAHYGIARALDLAGSYPEARRHFGRAIELSPEGSRDQALRMMGVSHVFVGEAGEAAAYFRQVFDRRTSAGNIGGAAEVANELGRVYLELGDPDSALEWYRAGYETASRQSDRPTWEVDLAEFRWVHAQARIAARRGDAREARRQQVAAKALLDKGTIADQEIQYPYLLGYVAFYLEDYGAAIAELQKADQADPFILLLLAQAFERSGDAARAREHYELVMASSSHAITNAFARPLARQQVE